MLRRPQAAMRPEWRRLLHLRYDPFRSLPKIRRRPVLEAQTPRGLHHRGWRCSRPWWPCCLGRGSEHPTEATCFDVADRFEDPAGPSATMRTARSSSWNPCRKGCQPRRTPKPTRPRRRRAAALSLPNPSSREHRSNRTAVQTMCLLGGERCLV